ncbi:MAG: hypothetical protein IPK92_08765 [Nitrospira sp.]|nr:hypothetical protein [Nitrospira sp.]
MHPAAIPVSTHSPSRSTIINPGGTTGPKLGAKFAVEPVQVGQVSLRAEGEPESNVHELGISLWVPNLEELRRTDEECLRSATRTIRNLFHL